MAEYAKSAELAARLENAKLDEHVAPRSIRAGGPFWYRWRTGPRSSHFVFVDPEKRLRRPAFNHESAARELRRAGIEAESTDLPFSSIDFDEYCVGVQFTAGGKRWLHSSDGYVTETSGQLPPGTLQPLKKEQASEAGLRSSASAFVSCTLTFENRLDEAVDLYWIDGGERANYYFSLLPGASRGQQTFVGHVWRVEKSKSHERVASFAAIPEDSFIAIDKDLIGSTSAVDSKNRLQETKQKGCIVGNKSLLNSLRRRPVLAFVHKHNLYLQVAGGGKKRISTTGSEQWPFNEKTLSSAKRGDFVAVWQSKPEEEIFITFLESSPPDQLRPRVKQKKYLRPGDGIAKARPRLFDVERSSEVETDDTLFSNPRLISQEGWNAEGTEYMIVYEDRGLKVTRLIGMGTNGTVRAIIEERCDTFIDSAAKGEYYFLEAMDEVIWSSERDGRNHLYLYDVQKGELKNRITDGDFNVVSVDEVDEYGERLFITVIGAVENESPYHEHLARVNLDGTGFRLLTHGDGNHDWHFVGNYLVDSWSRPDLPRQMVLRDGETGELLLKLESNSFEELMSLGWTVPERFAAPGRDGETMIHGIIIVPSHLDPEKKYPVIEDIYAGPHSFHVPAHFSLLKAQHELAELGFIVVLIDGMGTNWRSKAFHDVCHKNLKDAGLPDHIAWLRAAATTRPWMDLDRGVGLYGASAGGQNALAALLWHPEFYTVAVADSGCHDNRLDKLWWNEQYMGWPVDECYEESSNVVNAHRLRGKLLLIAGELDDNVDPAATMQVANALNRAGKDYELLIVQGAGHCPTKEGRHRRYASRRLRDFFVRHLMREEPPDWNKERWMK